ncbi:unnamed protein product, partial [marine sediment metagenome]
MPFNNNIRLSESANSSLNLAKQCIIAWHDKEQAAKERLAAERRFQQLFSEVQGYFSPEEAEVYKQGN